MHKLNHKLRNKIHHAVFLADEPREILSQLFVHIAVESAF